MFQPSTDPCILLVMGVAAAGKTALARALQARLHWPCQEGDALHPPENVAKMHGGTPLTDADRWPWLDRIADWIDARIAAGENGIVTCSALKRAYRDRLIGHRPGVRLIYLHGDRDMLAARIAARTGHFMPPSLLDSQLATLEPPGPDEHAIALDVAPPAEVVAEQAMAALFPAGRAAQAASDLLYAAWQAGEVLPELPAAIRPATRAQGYAIQALLERHSAAPPAGWKIAATSAAGQAHIGVDGPLAGRLLTERMLPSGATLPLGANRMRVAEVEFAFRLGADLPPRATPYTVDEAMAAVATLHPAIEIPDSRYSDFVRVGAPQLIADNACAHWFVLGPATDAAWRTLDLARHATAGEVTGQPAAHGSGANVLGDPRIAFAWLANELSALGIGLRAGQAVITGTSVVPMPIAAGVRVRADLGVLGEAILFVS